MSLGSSFGIRGVKTDDALYLAQGDNSYGAIQAEHFAKTHAFGGHMPSMVKPTCLVLQDQDHIDGCRRMYNAL